MALGTAELTDAAQRARPSPDHHADRIATREADLVARLDHPNILTVFDRGVADEQLWISMQYIDGTDAAAVDAWSLPPRRAVQIIGETAKALDFAHSRGILHRDVKPANILLEGAGGAGERVLLTDFGIARFRDETGRLTQTGTFTATLAYASPEQLSGALLDHLPVPHGVRSPHRNNSCRISQPRWCTSRPRRHLSTTGAPKTPLSTRLSMATAAAPSPTSWPVA
ncbi:serine/threonine-protein kinase [Nocardia sp. NPDC051052]|uniref:serine/threonine-protein kinase n=1 Tax=Nocardia sp. NPDC051052 TaxID=3364322 RepID=UPI0037930349